MAHIRDRNVAIVLKRLMRCKLLTRGAPFLGLLLALAIPASTKASPITWTTWTDATIANPGSATGTIGSVDVNYAGEVDRFYTNFPSWMPASTYSGGTVGNAPSPDDIIGLAGGSGTGTQTVTFSVPVVDPVMAIWSLGEPSILAEFTFTPSEPFAVQAGGPSNEFGGSSIYTGGTCPANTVCGYEGNGTIQFIGTFSSITWTNPRYEEWYGFDIGIAGVATPTAPTPEPPTLLLFATGLVGLAWVAIRRRRPTADC